MKRSRNRLYRALFACACLLILAVLSGCPKAPQKALDDAERALLDAQDTSDCASEKFLAAEQLLEEARQLVEKKDYDGAERKAKAAQKLALEAREYAEANWEDCERRRNLANQAQNPAPPASPEPEAGPADEGENLSLTTVYFPYNSSEVEPASRKALEDNVRWLRTNSEVTVVLEGHTDERGTAEYNLALGERRARSIRQYLVQMGINGERLVILSYGEEKPVAYGQAESDYSRNRRVEFVPQRR